MGTDPNQKSLDTLTRQLAKLRDLNPDMPLAQAMTLLAIAQMEEATPDGLSIGELANAVEIGASAASRYVAEFSAGSGGQRPKDGLGLVKAFEDIHARRRKIVQLTAKGRNFIKQLVEA